MICHIPEGIVPFDDCGYARSPLFPSAGEDIRLDCLCDRGVPVLETDLDAVHVPGAIPRGENRWRFILDPLPDALSFRYRFVCGEERTSWFSLDIFRKETVVSPLETGNGWVRLTAGVYLNFRDMESGFSACLSDHPEDAGLQLPSPWKLTVGEGGIWTLSHGERVRAQCRKLTLYIRADGTAACAETEVKGTQQHVWGTGERFDSVDQQGRGSCGQVVEHFTQQGSWTYLPVPFFMTDAGFGYCRNTACSLEMTFGTEIRIFSRLLPGQQDFWLLGTPAEQLGAYIHLTGQPCLPPEWSFGLWISANGWKCDADVEEQLGKLEKNRCPASVMVLEAWSDESTFYRWSRAWKDPKAMIRRVREAGLHLVLWQIPVIKALRDCPDMETVRADMEEAVSRGWVVRHGDGTPYRIPERWFEGSLLPDFTNPEACSWWFSRRDHLLEAGVEGFKTDGGEFLFGSDAVLWDGTPGEEAHNAYPMQYIKAYHQWMEKKGIRGLTFSRAGFAGAQTVPVHWAGDQLSTWGELKSQLNAGISAGLSGVLFWGFDIGGFAGELPDAELYLRATAFACFCPVMQWHAEPRNGQFYSTHGEAYNNDRSPWNLSEKLNAPELTGTACSFARLRDQLRPYIWQEAQYCVNHARPLMAHLCLDYPEDQTALSCPDEYMFGRKYLVSPVTEQGAEGRMVYFPEGKWRHFFTGETVQGPQRRYVSCPLTEAIVYEKTGEQEKG